MACSQRLAYLKSPSTSETDLTDSLASSRAPSLHQPYRHGDLALTRGRAWGDEVGLGRGGEGFVERFLLGHVGAGQGFERWEGVVVAVEGRGAGFEGLVGVLRGAGGCGVAEAGEGLGGGFGGGRVVREERLRRSTPLQRPADTSEAQAEREANPRMSALRERTVMGCGR